MWLKLSFWKRCLEQTERKQRQERRKRKKCQNILFQVKCVYKIYIFQAGGKVKSVRILSGAFKLFVRFHTTRGSCFSRLKILNLMWNLIFITSSTTKIETSNSLILIAQVMREFLILIIHFVPFNQRGHISLSLCGQYHIYTSWENSQSTPWFKRPTEVLSCKRGESRSVDCRVAINIMIVREASLQCSFF